MKTHAPDLDHAPTILVVEDEVLVRLHAAMLLEDLGFTVVEFANADDALRYLRDRSRSVSVIFTDLRMPGQVDGLKLAEIVSESWPWVSVVLTSGERSVQSDDLPPTVSFLPKPWRSHDVVARVHDMQTALNHEAVRH